MSNILRSFSSLYFATLLMVLATGFYRAIARQLSFALYWQSQHQQAKQPDIIFTDD